jgi:methyl-accepting chemotaxis protein
MTELEDLYARCRILGEKLADCTAGQLEFADELSRLRTENKRMSDMLEELLDYFQEEYDTVDDDNCQPMPNRAMKWGQAIEDALGMSGRYK